MGCEVTTQTMLFQIFLDYMVATTPVEYVKLITNCLDYIAPDGLARLIMETAMTATNEGLQDMDPEYEALCERALRVSETSGIIVALVVKVIFAAIGLVAQLYVSFWKKSFAQSFNRNARLLLNLHYFFVILSCVGTIASDGFDFYRLTIGKSLHRDVNCPIPPINPVISVILKVTKLFGTAGTSLSMFALTAERVYATLKPQTYQKVPISFGIFLGLAATAVDVVIAGLHFYHANYLHKVYLTTVTQGAMQMSLYMLYGSIAIEILVLLAQSILMLVNLGIVRGDNRILKSLNYKTQIRENVESLKFLCSLSFVQASLYLIMAILMPTVANIQTDETRKQLTTITTEVIAFYFVALPAIHIWRSFVKKRHTRQVQAMHNDNENRLRMEQKHHFEMLNHMLK